MFENQYQFENPYKTFDFRYPVEVKRNFKTGHCRNIFHVTQPVTLCWDLWGCSWTNREQQWAQTCIESYQNLPHLPTPVSPSEMAERWGCSHTWARKLILGSWDWIGVSYRHYVHFSWVGDDPSWVWKACLDAKNPLSCIAAVNKLREYVPAQDDELPAGESSVGGWLGMDSFKRLRAIGVLKPLQPLRSRHKMYYVPTRNPHQSRLGGLNKAHAQKNVHGQEKQYEHNRNP